MAEYEYDSDEERYANESFENESDAEITEQEESDDSASGSDFSSVVQRNSVDHTEKRRASGDASASAGGAYRHNRDYAIYGSSSDDENDVVISEVIAEINTAPMHLEEIGSPTPRPRVEWTGKQQQRNGTETVAKPAPPQEDSESEVYSSGSDEEDEFDDEMLKTPTTITREPATPAAADSDSDAATSVEAETTRGQSARQRQQNYVNYVKAVSASAESDILLERDVMDTASTMTFTKSSSNIKCAPNCDDCSDVSDTNNETETERDVNESDTGSTIYNNNYEKKMEAHITSNTPTSFNSDEYAFHMNLIPKNMTSSQTRLKAAHRKSWSFSNERVREIERQNQILLKKILTQKATYGPPKKTNSSMKLNVVPSSTRVTSAAVNRKKQQRQIDLDNQVLKRKIEAISLRRPHL